MSDALGAAVAGLEIDRALFEPRRLRERLDLLDRLDRDLVRASGEQRASIERLCAELEAANAQLYRTIREDIVRGAGAGAFLEWTRVSGPGVDGVDADALDGDRYDHLDALVSGVLQLDEPADAAALADEMVFYQPTPARHALALIERLALTERDVLVDIGSGLGHVPLLVAICSPAYCIGIERDAAYVDSARRCAEALGLRNVEFAAQDAREADLSAGTVFYLYTPFKGAMLDAVLRRLRSEAANRPIRVCTLGPCTEAVAREAWLATEDRLRAETPVLFHSRWSASRA